jgi:hypothetical protein
LTPSELWLPPGAIPFDDDVERVIAESDDPSEARRRAEELRDLGIEFSTDATFGAAVAAGSDPGQIILPREWGRMKLEGGRDVLCAYVDDKALERSLMDATIEVETFAVVEWAEHPLIHAVCPALSLGLRHYRTFTPLAWPDCPCPVDWRLECARGFAIAVPHPDPTETRHLYVASPPMTATPEGFTLGGTPRKVGRNDRCPCGSGIKFKRCCGG